MPLPRSTTPAEPTTPRLLTVSSMLPPHFPRRRLQRLMNFGALSRGFGTCCLRFKNDVATIPARLTSGWLARLYREGVDPLDRCKRFQVIHPPFLDLAWRKGSFMASPGIFRGARLQHQLGRRIDQMHVIEVCVKPHRLSWASRGGGLHACADLSTLRSTSPNH